MDRYLGLPVKNDPSGLPVTKDLRVTENGYPIKLGKGLFQTAKEIPYKQYMVPFHKECNRFENGAQTTNNPSTVASGCKEQFDKKMYSYITKVRNRRFLMADKEKGLVFGIQMFDMPGKREDFKYFPTPFDELPTRFYKPRSLLLAEMFKIVDGQILSIEAVMVNAPFGATSGW